MKLALSALTALVLAMLCERGTKLQSSWWKALAEESDAGVLLVLLGGVFILIFQVSREKQKNTETRIFVLLGVPFLIPKYSKTRLVTRVKNVCKANWNELFVNGPWACGSKPVFR